MESDQGHLFFRPFNSILSCNDKEGAENHLTSKAIDQCSPNMLKEYYNQLSFYSIYPIREPFVQHAVLDPWYGCAVRAACICPVEQKSVQMCPSTKASKIGGCMRNEQSAISIILAKLFREKYRAIVVNVGSFQKVMREQTYPYFEELRKTNGQNFP